MNYLEIKTHNDLDKLKLYLAKNQYDEQENTVRKIIKDIREKKDEALFEYCHKFDNFKANKDNINVSNTEFEQALSQVTLEQKETILYAKEKIENFHRAFLPKSCIIEQNGAILGTRVTSVKKAGLYIPGGKAFYPSTALMTIIPAYVAGVDEIYICTPAQNSYINPLLLYIAKLYNIENVFKVGGAQAIAALAYGTQSIPKVDVIAGPGNIYVAFAKKLVYGDVGIDSVAGPSEVMVVSDNCEKLYAAYDLLSQAEHDANAKVYYVGFNKECINKISDKFFELAKTAKRSEITLKSSQNALFIQTTRELAGQIIDEIAPEHLELQLNDPYSFMNSFKNAGAIFIGEYSCETLGDYVAGPNHTLPTSQTARFSSVLSTETFLKKSSIIHYTHKALQQDAPYAIKFAEYEGLFAHAEALKVRL
ncbi:Histidinol dehydrogenase [Desulfurella amilsii]|uniref:Histidinol dehydrogenase n=1 Tax=Desulfurella amilsii TaxID=1562698 RepID=A0A1X4XV16_9BACT|nr:histidinol dehydrogenase [Desulfurella amilsii]OSS41375.1 Histidinol dehydrogenase [Desulfurella amilsii]